jgi:RIO kinase 1
MSVSPAAAPDDTEPTRFPEPFDYTPLPDELPAGQRWSTWDDIGIIAGPEPWPDWLITADAAVDTDLGILKTGKEVIMAAKRYRGPDQRMFHRDSGYTEGRKIRRSRDRRAVAKGSRWGRQIQAGEWAMAEFGYLSELWRAGLPVPYPVQLDGTELLMELITLDDGSGAPRLAQTRPSRELLEVYFDQLRAAMCTMAGLGLTHGDLSAFNILATEDRLVIIDVPQAVNIVGNPQGPEFLARDCRNVATWFTARGREVDAEALFGEVVAYAW